MGYGTGDYGYAKSPRNQADEDQFNLRARANIGDLDALAKLDPNDPDNAPAELVKRLEKKAIREDQYQKQVAARVVNAEAWFTLHPEYLNLPANNNLMNNQLKTMFGEIEWGIEHYDAAYQSLVDVNFLQLDQAEVVKQRQAEARARGKAARARITAVTSENFNENINYDNLSLEEIRRRANNQTQRQMEKIAHEGGW